MYIDAICGQYADQCDLVALCDTSSVRMAYHNKRLASLTSVTRCPLSRPHDFTVMLGQRRPDVVIVTTVDTFHHLYIISAMQNGCDVVTEKPMTIDAEKVGAVLSAVEQTGAA